MGFSCGRNSKPKGVSGARRLASREVSEAHREKASESRANRSHPGSCKPELDCAWDKVTVSLAAAIRAVSPPVLLRSDGASVLGLDETARIGGTSPHRGCCTARSQTERQSDIHSLGEGGGRCPVRSASVPLRWKKELSRRLQVTVLDGSGLGDRLGRWWRPRPCVRRNNVGV